MSLEKCWTKKKKREDCDFKLCELRKHLEKLHMASCDKSDQIVLLQSQKQLINNWIIFKNKKLHWFFFLTLKSNRRVDPYSGMASNIHVHKNNNPLGKFIHVVLQHHLIIKKEKKKKKKLQHHFSLH